MSEKIFSFGAVSPNVATIKHNGEPMNIGEVVDKLNELAEENKELKQQIQNYEQLIANSYVGEEERLDGFVGKYVIWEDELQKYKNKNEMI